MSDRDREQLRSLDGLFVGQLRPDEMGLFERAVEEGLASRCYRGVAGHLGLAKVEVRT